MEHQLSRDDERQLFLSTHHRSFLPLSQNESSAFLTLASCSFRNKRFLSFHLSSQKLVFSQMNSEEQAILQRWIAAKTPNPCPSFSSSVSPIYATPLIRNTKINDCVLRRHLQPLEPSSRPPFDQKEIDSASTVKEFEQLFLSLKSRYKQVILLPAVTLVTVGTFYYQRFYTQENRRYVLRPAVLHKNCKSLSHIAPSKPR